jgi:hypothetical protein
MPEISKLKIKGFNVTSDTYVLEYINYGLQVFIQQAITIYLQGKLRLGIHYT